jgi:hypothetical protein
MGFINWVTKNQDVKNLKLNSRDTTLILAIKSILEVNYS